VVTEKTTSGIDSSHQRVVSVHLGGLLNRHQLLEEPSQTIYKKSPNKEHREAEAIL
jgi:hypothetical protein